jgi:tetratricopeptide (TPR) repeat protein
VYTAPLGWATRGARIAAVTRLTAQWLSRLGPWLRRLVPVIPVGAAFVLALTRIEDPDAFTHLALGRDLVERRGFPDREPFTYVSPDHPYYNPEWLFDTVLFLGWLAGGVAGVIVLKAALVALAVWILWLDSRAWGEAAAEWVPALVIRAAVLTAVVVMIRHRFVERPDIALMVFLAFTIYALNAYLAAGRRWIVALPFVQVLWANAHPSVVVGVAPFLAVLGGGLVLRLGLPMVARWWRPADVVMPTWRQLATVAVVLLGVLLAATLNPHGLDPLLLPFTLADRPWYRQEILELQPPQPWMWPGPFVMTALLLVSLLTTAGRLPVIPALIALPFVRLGLSAVRFIYLLHLVAGPILARHVVLLTVRARSAVERGMITGVAGLAAVAAVVAVVLAVLGQGPLTDERKQFGLAVNTRWVPEGALRYLDSRGVDGRLFNAFHFGGYIAWRDAPRRLAIVDGRGHVAPSLLEEIHFARVYPRHLAALHARYGFEAAVMDYPSYSGDPVEDVLGPDADVALASPEWALVYWDDVALVYLRREGPHAAVVARDEYREVKPANGGTAIARAASDPARAEGVRAELRRNVGDTGSSLGLLLLGHAAATPAEAIATFERVRDPARRFEADQAAALAAWRMKDYARASAYYDRALAVQASAAVLYNAGLVRMEAGDDREAVRYLARAQRSDPDLAAVYPALIAAHRRLGDEGAARELGPPFLAAATRARVEQHVREARTRLAAGRVDEADAQLADALKLDPRHAPALVLLGYVRMAQQRLDDAIAAEHAALAADPQQARAHWALAQIARARGDDGSARRHLQSFVRLAPRTYDAWRTREELASAARPGGSTAGPVPGPGFSPASSGGR